MAGIIAVICKNLREYEQFAKENPECVGKLTRPGEHERAFCASSEYSTMGRIVSEVVRYGNWQLRPNLRQIEDLLSMATIANPVAYQPSRFSK